jgi:uncharacterized protein YPO0396
MTVKVVIKFNFHIRLISPLFSIQLIRSQNQKVIFLRNPWKANVRFLAHACLRAASAGRLEMTLMI